MNEPLAVSNGLKLRWINGQCFEFQFSNGKTLLTDPWYSWPDQESPLGRVCPQQFSVDDLEGADYIFLNHCHGDHIANVQEVYDRFHSLILTHSATAMEAAKAFDVALTSIYPLDYGNTYYFDGFILETFHGTHHTQTSSLAESLERHRKRGLERNCLLQSMGSVFNMNFLLTTQEGLRIAFIGGNDDGMLSRLDGKNRPNVIIRNKMHSSKHLDNVSQDWADFFMQANTQMLIPMHYETWLTDRPEFAADVFRDMNRIMEENGRVGRVAPMERGKWYSLSLSLTELSV